MYRLFHKLFGWDYVAWQNTATSGIARVYKDGNGVVFHYYCGKYQSTITKRTQVKWLTCSPYKYMLEP